MVTPTTAATTGPVNQIKMKSKLYVQTYVATSRRQCSCMRYGSVLECSSIECRKKTKTKVITTANQKKGKYL